MNIKDYLTMVGQRIEDAAARGDKLEAVRLLRLVASVANEEADKLEK